MRQSDKKTACDRVWIQRKCYRVEAAVPITHLKLRCFRVCDEIWDNFVKNWYFVDIRLSVQYRFPFQILRSLPLNHLALLNGFFPQNYRLNNSFTLLEQFQIFKISKFDFKMTIHYVLWENTQLWPLRTFLIYIFRQMIIVEHLLWMFCTTQSITLILAVLAAYPTTTNWHSFTTACPMTVL